MITNITQARRTTETPIVYIGVKIEISTPIHKLFLESLFFNDK